MMMLMLLFRSATRSSYHLRYNIIRERERRMFSSSSCLKTSDRNTGRMNSLKEKFIGSHSIDTEVLHKLQELDRALRWRGHSTLRWGIGLVTCVGFGSYFFRDHIKHRAATDLADVVSSEHVIQRAEELSKGVVGQVLTDASVADQAGRFLIEMCARNDTREAIIGLLKGIVADPVALEYSTQFIKALLLGLLADASVKEHVMLFLNKIIVTPETKTAFINLFSNVFSDAAFQTLAGDFFKKQLSSETITLAASNLGIRIAHNLMDNENVLIHAKSFVGDVLKDDSVHQTGGKAIWASIKYSLVPSWGSSNNEASPDVPSTATIVIEPVTITTDSTDPLSSATTSDVLPKEYCSTSESTFDSKPATILERETTLVHFSNDTASTDSTGSFSGDTTTNVLPKENSESMDASNPGIALKQQEALADFSLESNTQQPTTIFKDSAGLPEKYSESLDETIHDINLQQQAEYTIEMNSHPIAIDVPSEYSSDVAELPVYVDATSFLANILAHPGRNYYHGMSSGGIDTTREQLSAHTTVETNEVVTSDIDQSTHDASIRSEMK